jgi:hypothetical protein
MGHGQEQQTTDMKLATWRWLTWRRGLAIGLVVGILAAGGLLVLRYERSCVFDGKRYYSGEGIPGLACNARHCENGELLYTWNDKRGCEDPYPRRECYRMEDARRTAHWRAWHDFREEFPGRVVTSSFLGTYQTPFYRLFQMRVSSPKLPPKRWLVWVLKDHCQSGVSERQINVPLLDGT